MLIESQIDYRYIRYFANFSQNNFARMQLWDYNKNNILLYISINSDNNLLKINSLRNNKWIKEYRKHFDRKNDCIHVEIHFSYNSVIIFIDKNEEFHLDNYFQELDQICLVETEGGIDPAMLELPAGLQYLDIPAGALRMTAPFRLEGWAFDFSASKPRHRIEVQGLADDLACITIPAPKLAAARQAPFDEIAVQSVLPGRIWMADEAAQAVTLRLWCNGKPVPQELEVARTEILELIESLSSEDPTIAIFEAVMAVEHVRFGRLLDDLSPAARAFIARAVETLNLREFLPEVVPIKAPPKDAPPPRVNLTELQAHDFHARYAEALCASPSAPRDDLKLLNSMLESELFLPAEVRQRILFGITQHFCGIDRFEEFYPLALAHHAAPLTLDEKDGTWRLSMTLPYLAIRGDLAAIEKGLVLLTKQANDWIVTAAIGWTIRFLLRNRVKASLSASADKIEPLLRAWLKLVDLHGARYWGRAQCVQFVDTAVALLAARQTLPPTVQAEITAVLLRCYGLTRAFWEKLKPLHAAGDLPAEFELGARAFAAIEKHFNGEEVDLAAALRLFAAWKTHDLPRFRIELFGPFSVPVTARDTGPDILGKLIETGIDVGEAVVRGVAFPGTAIEDKLLAEVSARKIREKRDTLKRSPQYELQKTACASARALLETARTDRSGLTSKRLDAFLQLVGTLEAGGGTSHVGIGLTTSLVCGLVAAGASEAARPLAGYVQAIVRARGSGPKSSIETSRYLQNVYPRLRALAETSVDPVVRGLAAVFPPRFAALPALPLDEVDPAIRKLWLDSSPLFDTLVVLYSCQAYLNTRVEEQRQGWLGDLARLGIPYLVAVGGGNGDLVGDVLYLDTPDDYENLRHKSLKLAHWVYEKTPFAHYLKVDDDCFINTEEYFNSLSWRKFNYYGRSVIRKPGKTPRNWHMGRATTDRGRLELNRSPEPTHFADGGSGYMLSRTAMAHIARYSQTPEGAHLRLSSVSEDKFIGDALAAAKIECQSEDNYVTVYRRKSLEGLPVLRWSNDFLPSRAAPVKLVHFDGHENRLRAMTLRDGAALWPKRLWPSTAPVRIGFGTKALELVSNEERLAEVNSHEVVVTGVLRNERFLLPSFLDHYRRLGVRGFILIDNLSDDGSIEYLAEQPDVAVFSADTDFKDTVYGSEWKLAIPSQLRVGRWTLVADLDEFLVYPGYKTRPLADYLRELDEAGANAVRVLMLDMYPKGSLAEADFTQIEPFAAAGFCDREPFVVRSLSLGTFGNAPTFTSALRHRVIDRARPEDFVAQKVPLLRYLPWMRLSSSLHNATDVVLAENPLLFAHFKYSAEFHAKVQREVLSAQHFNNAEEYKKYLDLIAEGRDVLFDPKVSVPWRESPYVKQILENYRHNS